MSEYFINYAEANLVCLIIFGIMLARGLLSVDRQEKQIKYDHALVSFMLYFVSDTFWAAIISGVIPKTTFTVVFANGLNYVFMAALTYMWLRYAMAVEHMPHRNRRSNKIKIQLPFLIATLALIITYIAAPDVIFNAEFRPTIVYSIFQIAVPIVYIVAVIIYSVRRARKEPNPDERKKYIYIGFFPLMVVVGGLLQILVLPNSSIFCFSCTILMLIFYIQSMETQISIDPLTKLNNRGQFARYIATESNEHIDGLKTFVVMVDINDFKSINDTYGHSEGDRALVMVADSLKTSLNNHNAPSFVGRFGGDEFVLVFHTAEESKVEELKEEIRERIKAECSSGKTEYDISVGIGYDELMGESDTFQKCLQRADHKLYLDKEYCKMNGNTTICR